MSPPVAVYERTEKMNNDRIENVATRIVLLGQNFVLTYDDLVMLNGIFSRSGKAREILVKRYIDSLTEDGKTLLKFYCACIRKEKGNLQSMRYLRRGGNHRINNARSTIAIAIQKRLNEMQDKLIEDVDVNVAFNELDPLDF